MVYRIKLLYCTFTWWGCCGLCFWHKPTELAHSFLFCSCVYLCLYGPFTCILFHKFSRQLSAFSLCSSSNISGFLVLSTMYLFMKVSFSPDIILCGWLGLKHQLTNYCVFPCSVPCRIASLPYWKYTTVLHYSAFHGSILYCKLIRCIA